MREITLGCSSQIVDRQSRTVREAESGVCVLFNPGWAEDTGICVNWVKLMKKDIGREKGRQRVKQCNKKNG